MFGNLSVLACAIVLALGASACAPPAVEHDHGPEDAVSQPVAVDVELKINLAGELFWNGEQISYEELEARCARIDAGQMEAAEIRVSVDRLTDYQLVARVFNVLQKCGLQKVGVIGGT